MPLADTSRAVGAVTDLLIGRIGQVTSHNVTIGRPEPPNGNGGGGLANPRLNLFLYEAVFDPQLKNTALDEGQEAPLWLVLRYLVTPFDADGESDTAPAFRVLGDGLRALQTLAYLPLAGLAPQDQAALDPNPERLKVSFQEASSDLLSRVMQGSDERYRFSMAFEVRPVMIAASAPAAYALLAGIDYTAPPPGVRDDGGRSITVEASLGPVIERVAPASFQAGDPPVRLEGKELSLDGLEVELGPVVLPLVLGPDGAARFEPTRAALDGASVSAGHHALFAARTLANGRRRRSNLAVVQLLPEVTAAAFVAPAAPGDAPEIDLTGFLLGTAEDDVVVGLYRDGATVRSSDDVVDAPVANPPDPPQTHRRARIAAPAVPAGAYRVILRVNGVQARQSPEVVFP
jgi:hypothetical protein